MNAVHSVAELLEAMVRIDSANPGLAEDGPGESELAAFVAGWAEAAGLRVEVLEPTSGRPSVLVRGGRGEGGRRLLLCGHLDTVGHAGMHEPLVPRVEGDRLYARGAYEKLTGPRPIGHANCAVPFADHPLAGPVESRTRSTVGSTMCGTRWTSRTPRRRSISIRPACSIGAMTVVSGG